MPLAATPLPSPGNVALTLSVNAALFAIFALACWGVEALWNKVFFRRSDRRPFPPQGAMPAARALKFTAIHMGWIVWATFAISSVLSLVLRRLGIELPPQDLLMWFADPACPWTTRLFIALFAVVEAPVVEELIFRRFVFRAILRGMPRVPFLAWLLSGTVFAVIHGNLFVCLPIIFLGTAFAWVYWRTGRIWTTMILHSAFNATSVLLLLAFPEMASL